MQGPSARLNDNTPLEVYTINGVPVHVKREDLCWPFPPLSKARGVWAAIEKRPGYNIAVVDTGRSLNGQLAATIGLTHGRQVKCGYPTYVKDPPGTIPGPALAIRSLGVELVPLQANRQFMMRAEMIRKVGEDAEFRKPGWFFLPTGLRLPETVEAVGVEAQKVWDILEPRTIIVPTGTGTHLTGIIKALADKPIFFIGVQGYARPLERFIDDVYRAANLARGAVQLRVVTSVVDYYEIRPDRLPPWPANPHYEVRAYKWLTTPGLIETLDQPIVLWNIGA